MGVLLAALLSAAAAEPAALEGFIARVLKAGVDQTITEGDARFSGLTGVDTPVRTVWLEAAQARDGRRRSFGVAYNSDGKTLEPAALVLMRLDGTEPWTSSAGRGVGRAVVGRTFVAHLDGRLAAVTRTERHQSKEGEDLGSTSDKLAVGDPKNQEDFRHELDFWLKGFDFSKWTLNRPLKPRQKRLKTAH
ncbi:hypothetical protein EPO15_05745 [bacterium]|nr:MAG: hypothetical protein EPO15_05745 [bacterium]